MDILYVNNDHIVEIQGLRDAEGRLVAGATAEATLYENDGETPVPGVSWPLSLTYTGDRGIYRGDLPPTLDVAAGKRYELLIRAEYAGRRYEVRRTVNVKERYR